MDNKQTSRKAVLSNKHRKASSKNLRYFKISSQKRQTLKKYKSSSLLYLAIIKISWKYKDNVLIGESDKILRCM